MTQEEQAAEVGRMTIAHSENEKFIGCLRSRLETVSEGLASYLRNPADKRSFDAARQSAGNVASDMGELEERLAKRERFRHFFKTQGLELGEG